jgi:hypothetical protein
VLWLGCAQTGAAVASNPIVVKTAVINLTRIIGFVDQFDARPERAPPPTGEFALPGSPA